MSGKEFRKWRQKTGVRVMEVTIGTGIHSNTVYRFEQGSKILPLYQEALNNFVKLHGSKSQDKHAAS